MGPSSALVRWNLRVRGKWVAESAQWPTLLQGVVPLPTVVIQEPQGQRQEVDRIEKPVSSPLMSLPSMPQYDQLKARQGNLSAVSIGELAKESGVPVPRLQQFLLSEARQDRVDLHATSLVWHSLSPEDKAGATAVPGRSEPAITVTIRQKLVTAALPAGLDIIKAYDDIVDGAEARKRLEQTNPSLVAARDKAITEKPHLTSATGLRCRCVMRPGFLTGVPQPELQPASRSVRTPGALYLG
jgi:hypothetical protein